MEKIDLEYSIKASGTEVKALHMRRPKCRDLLAVEKEGGTDAEQEFRLFANLTETAPEELRELDMVDYIKLQEVYAGFLSPGQKTSGEPLLPAPTTSTKV